MFLDGIPRWADRILPFQRVRYRSDDSSAEAAPTLTVTSHDSNRLHLLSYVDGARFLVNDEGTRIWADWPDSLSLEDIAVYLLGPVLGMVLRLRGTACLHASAFVFNGAGVAIVGESGAGKSTTVAALALRGLSVLSDDILAFRKVGVDWLGYPAYPHVKLWPQSSRMLFGATAELPRLVPTWDKEYLDLTRPEYKFFNQPAPIGAIFLLDARVNDPAAPYLTTLSPRDVLLWLLGNSYGGGLLNSETRAQEFECFAELAQRLPARRVVPHPDPTRLGRLCELVLTESLALGVSRSMSSV